MFWQSFWCLQKRSPRPPGSSTVVEIDVEKLRDLVLDVLIEECSDPRACALFMTEIEAKSAAGIIRDRVYAGLAKPSDEGK